MRVERQKRVLATAHIRHHHPSRRPKVASTHRWRVAKIRGPSQEAAHHVVATTRETPRHRCSTTPSGRTWPGPPRRSSTGKRWSSAQTGRRWRYAEFHLATRSMATALLERGIRPGDRVGIWSPNTAEWTLIQYATAQVGAILVTINPAYQSDELEYVLNQSSMCMVFAAPSFKTSDYVGMLDAVRGRCDALREVVIVGSPAWDADRARPRSTTTPSNARRLRCVPPTRSTSSTRPAPPAFPRARP